MTESEKLEQAAREYISSWVNPLGKENIEFTQGFEYAAFKAGVSWKEKEMQQDQEKTINNFLEWAYKKLHLTEQDSVVNLMAMSEEYIKELS
jgi:hypothetical protein